MDLIDLLLLERMALAAIVRVTGVSERWLQDYVNQT
ncbi:Insertion element protein [Candidatus Magnetobacterium bavaricum]|uniref:Insertion element protein n=1 Tax=Candidatus Magnetobacterium bavaricum TaxID=29290 RepID=A0A0F3GVZ5_9BACT|nr:Insertion element protein [Candidatus Magnetobacterium bavaricum]